jgi:hypothetical protein
MYVLKFRFRSGNATRRVDSARARAIDVTVTFPFRIVVDSVLRT